MGIILDKLKELAKEEVPVEEKRVKETNIERTVGIAATKIASDIDANCIIALEKKGKSEYGEEYLLDVDVIIFKSIRKGVYKRLEYSTKVHKVITGSILPIKEVLMEAVNKRYIEKDDRVVCVVGESMGMGYKALIFVFDVDKIFFNISTHKLTENIDPTVLENVINIALEIGREGREGRKVGTAFIVGDRNILDYTKQLIINPFVGYKKSRRNISDPNIRETVKEFAQLDGVFVVDEKGVILTVGAYIDVDTSDVEFKGLGARHRSCAALTQRTESIAVVVSTSGGIVRVIKDGKVVMKLP